MTKQKIKGNYGEEIAEVMIPNRKIEDEKVEKPRKTQVKAQRQLSPQSLSIGLGWSGWCCRNSLLGFASLQLKGRVR